MIALPHMAGTDLALSIALGVGLAAAVGFRVFVPMLVLSVAAYTGHLHLSSGLEWLGTAPAMVMFSITAMLEVLAYYIPGLDHLLDTIAAPAALIAGTVVTPRYHGPAADPQVEHGGHRRRRRGRAHPGADLAAAREVGSAHRRACQSGDLHAASSAAPSGFRCWRSPRH